MVVLSAVYKVAGNLPVSVSIFRGLQVIVIAIVARATITFGRNSVKCWQDAFLGLAATAFLVIGGSPILAILVAALAGICLYTKSHVHHERSNMQQSDRIPGVGRVVLAVLFITAIGLITLRFVNRQLYDIALVMMKVDVFAFGGGFASVPLMLHEVVHVRHWMSARTFLDGIALGQVTPGPIVITATFVGYQLAGIAGAAIGTVAIFIPSFLFLIMVVPYFDRLKANLVFQKALRGILASFVGLLLAVTVRFGLVVDWTFLSITLACGAFVALMLKVDILWVVLVGAGLSALILR
jgi:chromate transporter